MGCSLSQDIIDFCKNNRKAKEIPFRALNSKNPIKMNLLFALGWLKFKYTSKLNIFLKMLSKCQSIKGMRLKILFHLTFHDQFSDEAKKNNNKK